MAQVTETPLMKQYEEMKKKHPDAILLFRVGDFYETFCEDAITLSEICGVTLTRRANGKAASVELAGFPHHALDKHLPMLTKAGKRVAICEQLEDPKLSEKLVKRGEETSEEPKQESKPKKQPKPKETKIYGNKGIDFDSLDPGNIIASFRVKIPEDCGMLGKCVDKKEYREICNHVYIQPSTGKLLATNTKVLAIADIECKGEWPEDTEDVIGGNSVLNRFVAPISADAISKYAGQEIEVVTYKQDGKTTTLITSETAISVISAIQTNRIDYPVWDRVWFKGEQCVERIQLSKDALKALQGWFKTNKVSKDMRVEINVSKQADNVQFTLWKEVRCCEWEQIDDLYCDITSSYPSHDIHMSFSAKLFQINSLDGFNGEIWFAGPRKVIKFCGEQRESILMPKDSPRDKFEE